MDSSHPPTVPSQLSSSVDELKTLLKAVATATSPPPPQHSNKPDDIQSILKAVSSLTQLVATALPPRPQAQPRAGGTPGGVVSNGPPSGGECMFCGARDHYVRNCGVVEEYIRSGKVRKNDQNHIVLANGYYVPRATPGRTLQQRIDHCIANSAPKQASINFFESPGECIFSVEIAPSFDQSLPFASASETSHPAFAYTRRNPAPAEPSSPPVPNVFAPPRSNQPSLSKESSGQTSQGQTAQSQQPQGQASQRPQGPMRAIDLAPAEEPRHKYQSPVEAGLDVQPLVNRLLDSTVTLSSRELLAIAPDVRKLVKDAVTSKRVAINAVEAVEDPTPYSVNVHGSEEFPLTRDFGRYLRSPRAAVDTLPLRVINPTFPNDVRPTCILDSGAQMVIMREDVWQRIDVPIISNKAIKLEAANNSTSYTLGMIQDLPVTLGTVTVLLQVQVVRDAPFEVLLGRPFFDVLNAREISRTGGSHLLEIRDPVDDTPYLFHTRPRQQYRQQANSPDVQPANFRA